MATKYKYENTSKSVDNALAFILTMVSFAVCLLTIKHLSDTTREMNMYHKYYVVVDSLINSDKDLKYGIEQYGEYLDIAEKTKNSIGYE